jgi:cellulose synthase/poly-beta-1,6-N-acetylglucosamine synthase-like glycosyltransferase
LRRCALDDVGGFPTDSSIEDGLLEAFLVGKGYQTQFSHETLQFGLVPASWTLQMDQHLRRAMSPLRTARMCRLFLGGPRLAHMSFGGRVAFAARSLAPLAGLDSLIALVLFPAALLTDQFLIPVMSELHHFAGARLIREQPCPSFTP